jgi:hypothetical protein
VDHHAIIDLADRDLDKVKLSSTVPIVALYVVAAIVATGFPAFMAWNDRKYDEGSGQIIFDGHFAQIGRPFAGLHFTSHDMDVDLSGHFKFHLPYTADIGSFVLQGNGNIAPITLTLTLDKVQDELTVYLNNDLGNDNHWRVKLNGMTAVLTRALPLQPEPAVNVGPTTSANQQPSMDCRGQALPSGVRCAGT